MNRKTKKVKTREGDIEEVFLDLEKDLSNFWLTIIKRDKTIQEYVRLLKLKEIEYQKLFQKDKILKEKLEKNREEKIRKNKKRKIRTKEEIIRANNKNNNKSKKNRI